MREMAAFLSGLSAGLLLVQVLFYEPPPELPLIIEDLDPTPVARIAETPAPLREETPLLRVTTPAPLREETPLVRVTTPAPLPRPPRLRRRSTLGRTGLVVLAHDRVESTKACVAGVVGLREFSDLGAFEVSADAPTSWDGMERALKEFPVTVRRHTARTTGKKLFAGTALAKISAHIYVAIQSMFHEHPELDLVILLEDDLRVASDFLTLFDIGGRLLTNTTSWCVSAWNDNAGDASGGWRIEHIGKTTYFPGLGWMVGKETWERFLAPDWPTAPTTGWDHWVRTASSVRQRPCYFPEVPRVRHAATARSSNVLPKEAQRLERFAFFQGEKSPLQPLPEDFDASYDRDLATLVKTAPRASVGSLRGQSGTVVVLARFPEDLRPLAKALALWPSDLRGSYHGVVQARRPGGLVVLVVDRRTCDWLPPSEQIRFPQDAEIRPARAAGTSCSTVCSGAHLQCKDDLLRFIDDCDFLRSHFPCDNGCGHQLGFELPAFVVGDEPTRGQCLASNHATLQTCDAFHPATKRLCACVPPPR